MKHHILVVDDDPDIGQLITLILDSAGYAVTRSFSGADALEQLSQTAVDLVILDIMMPKMDGWEVCRRIKSRSDTKDLPVILLTVRNQPLDRVIGLEVVRADNYLTKPFERRDLLSMVERLLAPASSTVTQ